MSRSDRWIYLALVLAGIAVFLLAELDTDAHAQSVGSPYIPQFGDGPPTAGVTPVTGPYFDLYANYRGYTWVPSSGVWQAFGAGPQVFSLASSATISGSATAYYPVTGWTNSSSLSEASAASMFSEAGYFYGFYAKVSTAPGGTNTISFTMRINGATPSGTPSCTISGTATTCNDFTHSVSIAGGGTVDWLVQSTSGIAAGSIPAIAVNFWTW